MEKTEQIQCPECKAFVPDVPLDQAMLERKIRYWGSADAGPVGGCWKLFLDVQTRPWGSELFLQEHNVTLNDAYFVQHHGSPGRQVSAQSVTVHLFALYLLLEKKVPVALIRRQMSDLIARKKNSFVWLTPPKDPGLVTILDVWNATTEQDFIKQVTAWNWSVWNAWDQHHKAIRCL